MLPASETNSSDVLLLKGLASIFPSVYKLNWWRLALKKWDQQNIIVFPIGLVSRITNTFFVFVSFVSLIIIHKIILYTWRKIIQRFCARARGACVCVRACVRTYVPVCVRTYLCACMRAYMCVCVCARACVRAYVRVVCVCVDADDKRHSGYKRKP